MSKMTTGDACYIFKTITEEHTYEDKIEAIHRVLNMETKNGIAKTDLFIVIKWLLKRVEDFRKL